jgi:hypothetical protein
MRNLLSLLCAALTGVTFAQNAFALVSVEAGGGQKERAFLYDTSTEKDKKKSVNGSEYFASVYVDPIPLIPVAFGLAVQGYSYDTSKVDQEVLNDSLDSAGLTGTYSSTVDSKSSGMLYGPSIKVWAPIPFVKPYLKYTYLMGTEKATSDSSATSNATAPLSFALAVKGSTTSTRTGSDIQIGVGFSPIKLVGMFIEYAIHTGSTKLTDQNIDTTSTIGGATTSSTATKSDLTDDDKRSKKANSTSIRLGLSVGI